MNVSTSHSSKGCTNRHLLILPLNSSHRDNKDACISSNISWRK